MAWVCFCLRILHVFANEIDQKLTEWRNTPMYIVGIEKAHSETISFCFPKMRRALQNFRESWLLPLGPLSSLPQALTPHHLSISSMRTNMGAHLYHASLLPIHVSTASSCLCTPHMLFSKTRWTLLQATHRDSAELNSLSTGLLSFLKLLFCQALNNTNKLFSQQPLLALGRWTLVVPHYKNILPTMLQ